MSTPSSLTDPERAAPGTSSCSRFRIRRNVDFPQPDGPIRAVTWPASMDSETRSSTLLEPNHALTLVASRPDGDGPAACPGDGCAVTGTPYCCSVVVTAPPRDASHAAFAFAR